MADAEALIRDLRYLLTHEEKAVRASAKRRLVGQLPELEALIRASADAEKGKE